MSEARLLLLVWRYPHSTALTRRAPDGTVFAGLRRLEARGLVTRRRGLYRLTRRGAEELATSRVLDRLVARAHVAAGR